MLLLYPSTEKKVKINRQINQFCNVDKNRFWMLYYRITELKIDFKCQQCYKFELCQTYILKRIVKHMKAFNSKQESVVFIEVRKSLLNKNRTKINSETEKVIEHYHQKIMKFYHEKVFDNVSIMALIQIISYKLEDKKTKDSIQQQGQRYKLYNSSAILYDIFQNIPDKKQKIRETALLELLEREKFINYIKTPIESRFIDFVRSKTYRAELEEKSEELNSEERPILMDYDVKPLLEKLSNQEQIIYKLKYGIKLDNREFLSVSYYFKALQKQLMERFTPTEKLYIKFTIHYDLEESSEHFSILENLPEIKSSISTKILSYREKLFINSYKVEQDETVIKLIYAEPLTAKEIGELLNFTDKQIHKQIEKITKKLKTWKHYYE